ncbi:hypothetical protein [Listeria monocytogenes]|uniref:hypothetical protein n=1 Tax=Listeria monocytogenes TaxID=1639 RepID=UPI003F95B5ED
MELKDYLTVGISLLALLVSFLTLMKNRKVIKVRLSKNVIEVSEEDIRVFSSLGEENSIFGDGYLCTLEFINFSPSNIGFFDLRAFNPETNKNTYMLTERSIPIEYKDAKFYFKDKLISKNHYELVIPNQNYGTIPANSFIKLDLFIPKSEYFDTTLGISVKTTKRSFFSDPYADELMSKFSYKGTFYNLSTTEKSKKTNKQSYKSNN